VGQVTTQPALKAALATALAARPGLAGIQVDYGEPDQSRREAVLLSTEIDTSDMEQLVMRRNKREEDYTLRAHVMSAKLETPQKTEARAEVIAEEIEAAVLAQGTPPFGVANVSWVKVAGAELVTETASEGPITRLTVLLAVKGRIVT
jgi:hypothetical protein